MIQITLLFVSQHNTEDRLVPGPLPSPGSTAGPAHLLCCAGFPASSFWLFFIEYSFCRINAWLDRHWQTWHNCWMLLLAIKRGSLPKNNVVATNPFLLLIGSIVSRILMNPGKLCLAAANFSASPEKAVKRTSQQNRQISHKFAELISVAHTSRAVVKQSY